MKALMASVITLAAIAGCATNQKSTQNLEQNRKAASVNDVGVVGPNSEVFLYFKEGSNIVVKVCEPNTILGGTVDEARSNCAGRENLVPVENFKQAIRGIISIERAAQLRPLTPDEVKAYNSTRSLSVDQITAMQKELDKIEAFVAAYGGENANLPHRAELESALRSNDNQGSAIKKVNAEISKAIALIINNQKLTIVKSNPDKDQFLYAVLKNLNPNTKYPCGTEGSVEQRVEDCGYTPNSKNNGWVLVTRTKGFKEVWKDPKGNIWGDRLPEYMTHSNAVSACNGSLDENGGLTSLAFKLPSSEEYMAANNAGIRIVLPNIEFWFWTLSIYRGDVRNARLYGGNSGDLRSSAVRSDDFGNNLSVRCIAKAK